MKKICFVVPPFKMSSDRDMGPRHTTPHIGLAYVAGYIREKGYDVSVIDCPAEKLGMKGLEERLRGISPDMVAMTATSMQMKEAHETAGMVKARIGDIPIVIGGYHATAMPKETLEYSNHIDYAVFGEGELSFYELIMALEQKGSAEKIKGVAYRKGPDIFLNRPRLRISDLDRIPFPAFDLFPLEKYKACASLRKKREVSLCTTRGCPYQCIFCAKPLGSKVVSRSTDSVIAEMKRDIEELGVMQIVFSDENFTLDRRYVIELCGKIKNEGLDKKLEWWCETRVDLVDRDLLKTMKDAGCIYIAYGVDSGNDRILKKIRKNTRKEQAEKAVRISKECGIKVFVSCILGNPYEDEKTIKETIDHVMEIDPEYAAFSILTPFSGSGIQEMAKKGEGGLAIRSGKWSDYGRQIGNAIELDGVSRRRLENLQMKAYIRFYFRPRKILNFFRVADIAAIPFYIIHQLKSRL